MAVRDEGGAAPRIKSLMKRDWQGHQQFPRQGGMLVAANHVSCADWPAMSLFVHGATRCSWSRPRRST